MEPSRRRSVAHGPRGKAWNRDAFCSQPWPSSAKAGKCVNGSCPLEGCLEIEGANVEVDQCDWSTTPSQFLWELVTSGADAEHGGGGDGGGQLKNVLSGQCLTVRPLIS